MFLKDRLKITTERTYTDEGYLQVPSRISRTGIQEYYAIEMGVKDREPNDLIKVYRPPEEVFSEDSLKSFSNKPVTNNHPPELVNVGNYKKYSVGHSGNEVVRDGMFVKANLTLMDKEAIEDIESGKSELSNGYTSDIDWTPGVTPEGEQYDCIQRNIKGNHIAIVERGRAGSSVRVADNLPSLGDKTLMAKITIDGVDFEVSDQAAQAVGKLQTSLEDAEKEAKKKDDEVKAKEDEMEEKAKEAKKSEDSLRAKLDDAVSKIPSVSTLDSKVKARIDLIEDAKKVNPDIEWEGKDNDTIIREVVAGSSTKINMDSVSDDYIKARFDLLVESSDSNSQRTLDEALKDRMKKTDVVDNRPADVIAREKMIADNKNAWKRGGAK